MIGVFLPLFFILISLIVFIVNGHRGAIIFMVLLFMISFIVLFFFILRNVNYWRNKGYDKKIGNSSVIIDKEDHSFYIFTTATTKGISIEAKDYEKLHVNDKLVEFRQMKGKKVFSVINEQQKTFYVRY